MLNVSVFKDHSNAVYNNIIKERKLTTAISNEEKRVVFNVSGEIFETFESTLSRYPQTLLGDLDKRNLFLGASSSQYFFNRNRICFEAILYFYQSCGRLICPSEIQIPVFEAECRYFLLNEKVINRMKIREGILCDFEQRNKAYESKYSFQLKIWETIENPNSSRVAWVFGMISLAIIWLSIMAAFLETIPVFNEHANFHMIDLIINTWFITEYLTRFMFSRSKLEFLQSTMNIIDLFSILPNFIILIFQPLNVHVIHACDTFKVIRVLRLFRLCKFSRRVKIAGVVLKECLGNFTVLMICLITVIIFGGHTMHEFEGCHCHHGFTSIPQSLWWSVQTITGVGYGDLIPITIVGRMFASCFILFGGLVISIPVLSVISQFMTLYPKNVSYELFIKTQSMSEQQRSSYKEKYSHTAVTKEVAQRYSVTTLLTK